MADHHPSTSNPLLAGSVVKTELGQPVFASWDDAVEAIRAAGPDKGGYAYPLAELHLGLVPQPDGRVVVQGLVLHRREDAPPDNEDGDNR